MYEWKSAGMNEWINEIGYWLLNGWHWLSSAACLAAYDDTEKLEKNKELSSLL